MERKAQVLWEKFSMIKWHITAKKTLSNPSVLISLLIAILVVYVCLFAKNFGITWDEPSLQDYGTAVFHWYRTLGKDTSFLNLPAYIYNYSPFFEFVLIVFEHIFKHADIWFLRDIITGFVGVLGVILIALCGSEIEGPWTGLVAAVTLALYPRYIGDIFTNTKDIPFLVANLFALYAILRLVRRWDNRKSYLIESPLVGIAVGLNIAIRDIAFIWYIVLFIIWFSYWTHTLHKKPKMMAIVLQLKKQIISFLIILSVSLSLTILLWPYVFMDPLKNLPAALLYMANFPSGTVLFHGSYIPNGNLPWSYTFQWIFIVSPIATIIYFVLGSIILWYQLSMNRPAFKVGITFLTFIVPLLSIILLHSTLYNGIRQFLYVIPPFILIGAYGFVQLCYYLKSKRLNKTLIVLVILYTFFSALTLNDLRSLYPYDYIYFNEFAHGVQGANNQYDLDYWGQCLKSAAIWVGNNYRRYTNDRFPTYYTQIDLQTEHYLPHNFKAVQYSPDFYIYNVVGDLDNKYTGYNYKLIHSISKDGVDLCRVRTKPQ